MRAKQRHQQGFSLIEILVAFMILAMSLAILGGTFFSLARAPEFVSNLSLITPHAWFLRGLDELASPTGAVSDVLLAVAVMVGIGIVTGGIGLMRARRLVVGR